MTNQLTKYDDSNKISDDDLSDNDLIKLVEDMICEDDLQRACFHGNFDKVKKIINSGNYNKEQYPCVIIIAAFYGYVDIIVFLLSKGFDPNECNSIIFSGNSALMLFIENNNIDGVIALLRANCNIEHKNFHDETALLLAVKLGNIEIVQELINNGANVNALNNHEYSPLFVAISIKNADIVTLLINSGADVNQKTNNLDNKPTAPLDYAHNTLSIKIDGKYKINKYYIRIIKDLLRAGAKTRYNIDHNQSGNRPISGNKRSSDEIDSE